MRSWLLKLCRTTALLITGGCSSDDARPIAGEPQPPSAQWTAEEAWRLDEKPIVRIEGSEENLKNAPVDPVAVFRLPDGRYVVADGNQNGWNALLVYTASGRFIEQWGRYGQGPGEFHQLFTWASLFRGDSIAAYDFPDRAIEVFGSTGEFARSIKFEQPRPDRATIPRGANFFSSDIRGVFADGSALSTGYGIPRIQEVGPYVWEHDIGVTAPDGGAWRKIANLPLGIGWWSGRRDQQYPFSPWGRIAVGSNEWYYGTGKDFSVQVFDRAGKVIRTVRRDHVPQPVTAQDREDYLTFYTSLSSPEITPAVRARMATEVRNAHFAETKPAYSDLVVDDLGNLWVEHFRWVGKNHMAPAPKPTRWSVFDQAGGFLGEVVVPASFVISSITKDQVLGFYQDDLDVKHVHIYQLIKPK